MKWCSAVRLALSRGVSGVADTLGDGCRRRWRVRTDERAWVPRSWVLESVRPSRDGSAGNPATAGPDLPQAQDDSTAPPNTYPASCITFLSEQAFAPQNTRFWSRRRVWFQFTVGEDKPPMLSVGNRGKGVLSMDCSAKRSPF